MSGLQSWRTSEEQLTLSVWTCGKHLTLSFHDILVVKLGGHGFDRWTTRWIRNRLCGCTQRSMIGCPSVDLCQVTSSGLVLGLMLFNIFDGDMDRRF